MTDQTQDQGQPEGMGILSNLDQFAFLVTEWFKNGHQQVRHLLEVPEGQTVTVTFEVDGQPEEVVLTGDVLKGFKAGVIATISIFGKLPFEAVQEQAPVEPPADIEVNESGRLQLVASNDQPASGN